MNFFKSKIFLFFSIILFLLLLLYSYKIYFTLEILFADNLTNTSFYKERQFYPDSFSLIEEKALFFRARHLSDKTALNILSCLAKDRKDDPSYLTIGRIGQLGIVKFPNDPQWTGYILLSKLSQGNKLTEEEEQFLLLQLRQNTIHPSIFVSTLCKHRIYNHTNFLKEQQNFLSKNRNDIPCKFEE